MLTTTLDWWWPVTYDFGMIKSEIECVATARFKIYKEAGLKATTEWLDKPLDDCFRVLEPLSPAPTKELFVATNGGWTAYFSNGCRGSDPFLPMFQLSKALGVMALRICRTHASALYQAVILEVYDTPQSGADKHGYRRSIVAANDGGRWVFEQSGTPYAFEDVSKFGAKLKRDRFTPEMLSLYLEDLGVPLPSDEAFNQDGMSRCFMLSRPKHEHLSSYSLEEAKSL